MTTGEWMILTLGAIFGIVIIKKLNTMALTNEQAVAKINAQTEKLVKIQGEIQVLKDAINNSGNVSPEVEAALANLEATVTATDELNEDAPTEPPAE